QVAREVGELNQAERAGGTLGSAGLVVGATIGAAAAELGVDLAAVNGPLLAPGLGAQGGTTADLARVFAGALGAVVPTTSRTVLPAGPAVAPIAAPAGPVGGRLTNLANEGSACSGRRSPAGRGWPRSDQTREIAANDSVPDAEGATP